jgi:hypothetical protein
MGRHRCADYFKAPFFGKSVANKLENSLRACTTLWLLVLAPFTSANGLLTLNQDCVVSILNRTVQAEVDGTFEMPNVPAAMGSAAARL